MKRFCDSAGVPSSGTLALAKRGGVHAWAGYLSSPYAARSWSADELTHTLAGLGELLPIYVGPYPKTRRPTRADFYAAVHNADPVADAHRALTAAHAIRQRAAGTLPIILDLEAPLWSANPAGVLHYFAAFVAHIHAADVHALVVPYSSPSCLIGLGQHDRIGDVWAASWLTATAWPKTITPPGLGTAWAGRRAWQYHGGTRAFGMNVDLNVCDDTFPMVRHYTRPAPAPTPVAPRPAPTPAASATVVVGGKTYRGNLAAV